MLTTPIPPPPSTAVLEDGPSEYLDGWTVANELLKELPSNKLQSHDRVEYIGDTVYPSECVCVCVCGGGMRESVCVEGG